MRPKLHTAEEFLDGKIAADQEDFDDEKSVIAGANQGKSEAECDLSMITKDLAVANNNLATVDGDGDCRLLHLTMRPKKGINAFTEEPCAFKKFGDPEDVDDDEVCLNSTERWA